MYIIKYIYKFSMINNKKNYILFIERNIVDRDPNTLLNKMEGGDGPSAISSNPTAIKGNIYDFSLILFHVNNQFLFILFL